MKASANNFLAVIKGPKQLVIPIYQRTYSWQIAQCKKLLQDILRISKGPSVQVHFLNLSRHCQRCPNHKTLPAS